MGRLSAGRVIAALISAAWLILAARQLPVRDFGDLALILAVGMIFSSIADAGYPVLLADTVVRHPAAARDALLRTTRVRMLLAVGAALAASAAYLSAANDARPVIPLVFAGSMIASTIYSSAATVFMAQGRVGPGAANEVVSRLFVLCLGGWLLSRGGGLLAAISTYALADILSAISLGIAALGWTAQAREPVPSDSLTVRRAAPLALTGCVATVYYRVDIYILALLAGPRAVGLYASCYRIFDGLLLPGTAISSLAVPLTAGLDYSSQMRRLTKLCGLGLLVTVPVAAVIATNPARVLRALLGAQYASAGTLLLVLLLGLIPSLIVGVLVTRATLMSSRTVTRCLAACLALDVTLIVAGVPTYGAYAAAWATVISQTVLAALVVRVFLRAQG